MTVIVITITDEQFQLRMKKQQSLRLNFKSWGTFNVKLRFGPELELDECPSCWAGSPGSTSSGTSPGPAWFIFYKDQKWMVPLYY